MRPEETRVVFMGSPEFAVPSLEALVEAEYDVVGAVTQPGRRAGRGGRLQQPPVFDEAEVLGVDVLQPETLKDEGVRAWLRDLEPDVFVVAAYGKILAPAVLRIPRRGAVNVHASLLPRWRGASPVSAALLAGDAVTGVTLMEMVREMDAGPIIAQREIPIPPGATAAAFEPVLADMGAALLIDALPGWLDGEIVATPQDEAAATYCRTLRKEDGHLRASMTAEEAERAVRAYQPWPGAYVVYRGEPLRIHRAHVAEGRDAPGTITVEGRQPAISFAEGRLVLDEVQKPGKRPVGGADFLNGERGKLPPAVELAA